MCLLLVIILSTVVLHSVSAGGAYCAKTARARAAALGLDYPGVHGAPDLHGMHPSTMPLGHYKNFGETEPNTAYYRQNDPGVRSSDNSQHQSVHPWSSESTFQLSHGTYNPVQSQYPSEQVLGPLRGQQVSNRGSSFDEVKHVAPQIWAEAPSFGKPQGHTQPLSFVSNEHDLVFDESLLNRHAVSFSRLPMPQHRGHGGNQRGLTRHGLGRVVPGLGSPHFINQGPKLARWERIWLPAYNAQLLHRNDVKKSVGRRW